MTTQAEALLEKNLIEQLTGLEYGHVAVQDEESLLTNLQSQLGAFNETTFSAREFGAILNHLAKGNVFAKAKTLRDRLQLNRDNGESFYVRFFDGEEWGHNIPSKDIERRFARSLQNLLNSYCTAANRTRCFMNTDDEPAPVFELQGNLLSIFNQDLYQHLVKKADL